ncbi:MAG: phospho-sugar mutase [Acidimicrobiales bacterium]
MTDPGSLTAELSDAVDRWMAADDEYRTDLAALLEDDRAELARLFDGRIAFGTAGLRAAMGPGPRQMNRLVVQQTTAGLMDWLPAGAKVVIGYDARYHSKTFAQDVARVVTTRGGTAELIDRPAPTPVLARAVLDRSADAGVMITASHNPATDNGYKLYLADGIQLVSPADGEIADAIDRVVEAGPGVGSSASDADRGAGNTAAADVPDIADRAIDSHRSTAIAALLTDHRDVAVLYTAMHGVGGRHMVSCFEQAGFPAPIVVSEQFDPDPDFPTAPFPNPEEPGAFDLAYATIERLPPGSVDIILANDPDADRLAVGIAGDDGRWRRLSGDEVGALLIDHVLRHTERPPAGAGADLVASSIVSSRFIDRLAEAAGVESIRTLTGFKWVARPIVERPGDRFLLGYEEALGYCIGDRVRDKDGISAALVMAELAAECKASGSTVSRRLDELIEQHGLYATSQVTVSIAGLDDAGRTAAKERAVSLDPPEIGGVAVVEREDLALGERLPPTSGVVLQLADGSRLIVRPSGTEPKIKAYLEVIEDGGPAGNAEEARRRAELRLEQLARAAEALLVD